MDDAPFTTAFEWSFPASPHYIKEIIIGIILVLCMGTPIHAVTEYPYIALGSGEDINDDNESKHGSGICLSGGSEAKCSGARGGPTVVPAGDSATKGATGGGEKGADGERGGRERESEPATGNQGQGQRQGAFPAAPQATHPRRLGFEDQGVCRKDASCQPSLWPAPSKRSQKCELNIPLYQEPTVCWPAQMPRLNRPTRADLQAPVTHNEAAPASVLERPPSGVAAAARAPGEAAGARRMPSSAAVLRGAAVVRKGGGLFLVAGARGRSPASAPPAAGAAPPRPAPLAAPQDALQRLRTPWFPPPPPSTRPGPSRYEQLPTTAPLEGAHTESRNDHVHVSTYEVREHVENFCPPPTLFANITSSRDYSESALPKKTPPGNLPKTLFFKKNFATESSSTIMLGRDSRSDWEARNKLPTSLANAKAGNEDSAIECLLTRAGATDNGSHQRYNLRQQMNSSPTFGMLAAKRFKDINTFEVSTSLATTQSKNASNDLYSKQQVTLSNEQTGITSLEKQPCSSADEGLDASSRMSDDTSCSEAVYLKKAIREIANAATGCVQRLFEDPEAAHRRSQTEDSPLSIENTQRRSILSARRRRRSRISASSLEGGGGIAEARSGAGGTGESEGAMAGAEAGAPARRPRSPSPVPQRVCLRLRRSRFRPSPLFPVSATAAPAAFASPEDTRAADLPPRGSSSPPAEDEAVATQWRGHRSRRLSCGPGWCPVAHDLPQQPLCRACLEELESGADPSAAAAAAVPSPPSPPPQAVAAEGSSAEVAASDTLTLLPQPCLYTLYDSSIKAVSSISSSSISFSTKCVNYTDISEEKQYFEEVITKLLQPLTTDCDNLNAMGLNDMLSPEERVRHFLENYNKSDNNFQQEPFKHKKLNELCLNLSNFSLEVDQNTVSPVPPFTSTCENEDGTQLNTEFLLDFLGDESRRNKGKEDSFRFRERKESADNDDDLSIVTPNKEQFMYDMVNTSVELIAEVKGSDSTGQKQCTSPSEGTMESLLFINPSRQLLLSASMQEEDGVNVEEESTLTGESRDSEGAESSSRAGRQRAKWRRWRRALGSSASPTRSRVRRRAHSRPSALPDLAQLADALPDSAGALLWLASLAKTICQGDSAAPPAAEGAVVNAIDSRGSTAMAELPIPNASSQVTFLAKAAKSINSLLLLHTFKSIVTEQLHNIPPNSTSTQTDVSIGTCSTSSEKKSVAQTRIRIKPKASIRQTISVPPTLRNRSKACQIGSSSEFVNMGPRDRQPRLTEGQRERSKSVSPNSALISKRPTSIRPRRDPPIVPVQRTLKPPFSTSRARSSIQNQLIIETCNTISPTAPWDRYPRLKGNATDTKESRVGEGPSQTIDSAASESKRATTRPQAAQPSRVRASLSASTTQRAAFARKCDTSYRHRSVPLAPMQIRNNIPQSNKKSSNNETQSSTDRSSSSSPPRRLELKPRSSRRRVSMVSPSESQQKSPQRPKSSNSCLKSPQDDINRKSGIMTRKMNLASLETTPTRAVPKKPKANTRPNSSHLPYNIERVRNKSPKPSVSAIRFHPNIKNSSSSTTFNYVTGKQENSRDHSRPKDERSALTGKARVRHTPSKATKVSGELKFTEKKLSKVTRGLHPGSETPSQLWTSKVATRRSRSAGSASTVSTDSKTSSTAPPSSEKSTSESEGFLHHILQDALGSLRRFSTSPPRRAADKQLPSAATAVAMAVQAARSALPADSEADSAAPSLPSPPRRRSPHSASSSVDGSSPPAGRAANNASESRTSDRARVSHLPNPEPTFEDPCSVPQRLPAGGCENVRGADSSAIKNCQETIPSLKKTANFVDHTHKMCDFVNTSGSPKRDQLESIPGIFTAFQNEFVSQDKECFSQFENNEVSKNNVLEAWVSSQPTENDSSKCFVDVGKNVENRLDTTSTLEGTNEYSLDIKVENTGEMVIDVNVADTTTNSTSVYTRTKVVENVKKHANIPAQEMALISRTYKKAAALDISRRKSKRVNVCVKASHLCKDSKRTNVRSSGNIRKDSLTTTHAKCALYATRPKKSPSVIVLHRRKIPQSRHSLMTDVSCSLTSDSETSESTDGAESCVSRCPLSPQARFRNTGQGGIHLDRPEAFLNSDSLREVSHIEDMRSLSNRQKAIAISPGQRPPRVPALLRTPVRTSEIPWQKWTYPVSEWEVGSVASAAPSVSEDASTLVSASNDVRAASPPPAVKSTPTAPAAYEMSTVPSTHSVPEAPAVTATSVALSAPEARATSPSAANVHGRHSPRSATEQSHMLELRERFDNVESSAVQCKPRTSGGESSTSTVPPSAAPTLLSPRPQTPSTLDDQEEEAAVAAAMEAMAAAMRGEWHGSQVTQQQLEALARALEQALINDMPLPHPFQGLASALPSGATRLEDVPEESVSAVAAALDPAPAPAPAPALAASAPRPASRSCSGQHSTAHRRHPRDSPPHGKRAPH